MFYVLKVRNIGISKMNVLIMFLLVFQGTLSFNFLLYYQTFLYKSQINATGDELAVIGSTSGQILSILTIIVSFGTAVVYDTCGRKIPMMIIMLFGAAQMFLLPLVGHDDVVMFYVIYAIAAAWNLI